MKDSNENGISPVGRAREILVSNAFVAEWMKWGADTISKRGLPCHLSLLRSKRKGCSPPLVRNPINKDMAGGLLEPAAQVIPPSHYKARPGAFQAAQPGCRAL